MKKACEVLLKICEVCSIIISVLLILIGFCNILFGNSINMKEIYEQAGYSDLAIIYPNIGLSVIGWFMTLFGIFLLVNFFICRRTLNNKTTTNYIVALVFGFLCQSLLQIIGAILGLCAISEEEKKQDTVENLE